MSQTGGKTILYTGGGVSGVLTDAANWGGTAPGLLDTALIERYAAGVVTATTSVNNMMLLGHFAITFGGTLDLAGVGNCKGLMVCAGATATFAPGAVVNDGNVLQVGVISVGTLIAQGSGSTRAVLNSESGNIGKEANGVGVVTIDDASWTTQKDLLVGMKGTGTLDVTDAGSVTVGKNLAIGDQAGASGTVDIASGSRIGVAHWARLGSADTSGAGVGHLTVGTGSSFSAGDGLSVKAGSGVTLGGGTVSAAKLAVDAGATVTGHGTLAGDIDDAGVIRSVGGTLVIDGAVHGAGVIQIGAGSTVKLDAITRPTVTFLTNSGTLALAATAAPTLIAGFAAGDAITVAHADSLAWNPATSMLMLFNGTTMVENLHLAGSYAHQTFALSQTGTGAMVTLHAS